MSQTATRTQALARFEQSRAVFRRLLEQAPPESLRHLPEGEDLALGGLVSHVNAVLEHYRTILRTTIDEDFAEVTPVDPPGLFEEADARARAGLAPEELGHELAAMDALHAGVLDQVARVAEAEWLRPAPIHYQPGDEALPTSCDDVIGWLSGHYEEHAPHADRLLESWRATPR
jgi:hypothetical protein